MSSGPRLATQDIKTWVRRKLCDHPPSPTPLSPTTTNGTEEGVGGLSLSTLGAGDGFPPEAETTTGLCNAVLILLCAGTDEQSSPHSEPAISVHSQALA